MKKYFTGTFEQCVDMAYPYVEKLCDMPKSVFIELYKEQSPPEESYNSVDVAIIYAVCFNIVKRSRYIKTDVYKRLVEIDSENTDLSTINEPGEIRHITITTGFNDPNV